MGFMLPNWPEPPPPRPIPWAALAVGAIVGFAAACGLFGAILSV